MRHDGCGGLAAKTELPTGIKGVSSRPVRRIVFITKHSKLRGCAVLSQNS
jgi:hypothetical protein